MGTWGAGVRQDDLVCDIEGAFKEHLTDGKSVSDSSHPEHPTDLVAELDYLSDQQPTIKVFTRRMWLRLTHHNWRGRLNIL